MNVPIIDPLQGDFPEVIEEYLQHGTMKCISFNRRGTLLAAGCLDGSCVIWDFETRGISKELRGKDCTVAITSICWSKYGRHILASAADKSLILWDVISGEKIARATLQQATLHARLHPGFHVPSICLACPLSSPPIIVDLNNGNTTLLPVSVTDEGTDMVPHSRNKLTDGAPPLTPTAASFNKDGDLIYVGNSKGEILIIDSKNIRVCALISVSGASVIKNIVFSRNGLYLLTNSNDRTIRIYENHLPRKNGLRTLEEFSVMMHEKEGIDKLKVIGSKYLVLCREIQDSVNRIQWKCPCFSGDSEWVVAASASRGEHNIHIWGRDGQFVKTLEGPKEALTDLAWHPVRPIVVSVSITGWVYIWAKDYTENWSAFAPDFKELEENEEYIEREDEFDLMPDTEKVKESDINEDEEVDIMTVEKDSAFSDSDASQEELCFLPAAPSPDVPEEQDKFVGSSSKLGNGTPSRSPFSEEAEQNGQDINIALSPAEAVANSTMDDAGTTGRIKRKRKPSEKGLEFQAEKVRKPLVKSKPTGKSLKNRSKSVNGQENDTSVLEDDVTDE